MNSHLAPDHDREHCWCKPIIVIGGPVPDELLCGEGIEEILNDGCDGTP